MGYVTTIVGVVGTHAASLPWWVSLVTGVAGTVAAHYAPQPGQNQ